MKTSKSQMALCRSPIRERSDHLPVAGNPFDDLASFLLEPLPFPLQSALNRTIPHPIFFSSRSVWFSDLSCVAALRSPNDFYR